MIVAGRNKINDYNKPWFVQKLLAAKSRTTQQRNMSIVRSHKPVD